MVFNIANEKGVRDAKSYLNHLQSEGLTIEIKPWKPRRSLRQNSFLHLTLSILAIELGETLEYTKQVIFKEIINNELFQYDRVNPKTNISRVAWKSTRDLTTAEMTSAIERLRDYSNVELGIYLPSADEKDSISDMEVYVKNNNQFLH